MAKKKPHCYAFPRPALTVDLVLISKEARPRVLLIRSKHDPFARKWAFPGGFVDENESLEAAARRGVKVGSLEQLPAFGDPDRDPRGWTVTVAFISRVDPRKLKPKADDDAAEVEWHFADEPPPLAFDHARILKMALRMLRATT